MKALDSSLPVTTGFTNFTRLRDLFEQGQSVAPQHLEAWLIGISQGNATLYFDLKQMLAASSEMPETDRIGPYRLVRELGRGGMGVVYLATRDDGIFRKNVALKLLLQGNASHEAVQRFKQERQVVAALDHPNIARILDGGDTAEGMPYYVMEFVEGQPIDQYCDSLRLDVKERIKLFQQACRAVGNLHQNLIVHRDLKPCNMLVSRDGIVKLIDFGIAKMFGAASVANPWMTGFAGRPLTPAYASPEQLQGASVLPPPSDIYSLGVILYKLLTGQTPYRNLDDKIAKLASGQNPSLPSLNIWHGGDYAASDLDSIVLKALKTNPKQRYQTTTELSEDLQLFLEGRPVTARISAARSFSKLLRRELGIVAVLGASLFFSALGAWQMYQAEKIRAAPTVTAPCPNHKVGLNHVDWTIGNGTRFNRVSESAAQGDKERDSRASGIQFRLSAVKPIADLAAVAGRSLFRDRRQAQRI